MSAAEKASRLSYNSEWQQCAEVICKTMACRGHVSRRSQREQSVLAYYAERQGGKGAALAFGCHEVTGWSEAEVLQSILQQHCDIPLANPA